MFTTKIATNLLKYKNFKISEEKIEIWKKSKFTKN